MAKVALTYEGPQALVVELGQEVNFGDTLEVEEAIASKLLFSSGFREANKAPSPPEAPEESFKGKGGES